MNQASDLNEQIQIQTKYKPEHNESDCNLKVLNNDTILYACSNFNSSCNLIVKINVSNIGIYNSTNNKKILILLTVPIFGEAIGK